MPNALKKYDICDNLHKSSINCGIVKIFLGQPCGMPRPYSNY